MKTKEATVARKFDLQQAVMADFRQVTLHFRNGDAISTSEHLVHKDDVDALVEASKKLHYDPGINPHCGRKTSQIYMISVATPYIAGPYWWSTPGLGKIKDESSGANLINWSGKTVWMSPEYKEELRLRDEYLREKY